MAASGGRSSWLGLATKSVRIRPAASIVERSDRMMIRSPPDSAAIRIVQRCPGRGKSMRLISRGVRSEEHTSELQSLMRISYAVFCLKTKNKAEQRQNINVETTEYGKYAHI